MKKAQYIILILCLLVGFSCAVDESCRTNRTVLMNVGMYHVTKNTLTRTSTSMVLDSLTVRGLKYDNALNKYVYVDSVLYNNAKGLNKINLPLQSFEPTSVYEIVFNATVTTPNVLTNKDDIVIYKNKKDTFTVAHQNIDKYLSLECGSIKIHSVDTVLTTNNFIDSVRITKRQVNNINVENIQIYK